MRYFLLFCTLLVSSLLRPVQAAASPELLDRIVAVVDNQIILWSEVNFRVALELEQSGQARFLDPSALESLLDSLREQTLDAMIDEQGS